MLERGFHLRVYHGDINDSPAALCHVTHIIRTCKVEPTYFPTRLIAFFQDSKLCIKVEEMENIMDGRYRSCFLLLAVGAIASCRAFLLSTPGPTARYGSLDRCLVTASTVRAQSYTQVRAADSMTHEEDVPIIFESLMAGDIAGVEEYVRSGGDCNVRDSIGEHL